MAVPIPGGEDAWLLDDATAATPNPMMRSGAKLTWKRQTGNTVAGNVGNAGLGTVALPALNAGATGTVTISDSLIGTASLIFVFVARGTTTPAAGAIASIIVDAQAPTAGSVVLDLRNAGTAATLSTDYVVWYLVIN